MKTVSDIRNEFISFFEGKGHEHVSSASLVPHNDPTLLFVNSGMAQFKNLFTGVESRDYTRATTAQKCVRAGGKHNDLENVGYTARHHTFFEMMGNFSFGDYFKEEAISYAWDLISNTFEMPKDKLLVTVYHDDDEAVDLWKKIGGFSDDKIIRIATDDNFWRMGETGPCGPCSEIFYDQGEELQGGPPGSPDEDGDRFLEFWNLVFMQYEQIDAETRVKLPAPCIDTGMGLERMAALSQGKKTNYDIDLLHDIIEHSADLTGISPDGDQAPSHRVIADHLRTASFLIADGVMPSNEGRGYVLRRIMRRGMRHAHLLGSSEPLLYRLFPTLNAKMGSTYPELKRAEALITETLKSEEERFKVTLERGLKLLDTATDGMNEGDTLAGDTAFKLYDTFGFPLDLTQDALRERGVNVDEQGFQSCMDEQKAKARAAWKGSGDAGTEKLWFDILDDVGTTEFLGYDTEHAEAQIVALVKDSKRVEKLSAGDQGIVITNQTPFYGESGGQVGDTGILNAGITVTDTHKALGALFLHHVSLGKGDGDINTGDAVSLRVDNARRAAIRANHSATHLLHESLRETLGEHVAQKGSRQDANRTRFDVSHNKAITAAQLTAIEAQVNAEIIANTRVETRVMPIEDARETGAMALFGEKYDDEVRVVSMGTINGSVKKPYSVELCGGTHVNRTGDIGLFKIISEGALSSGVRRVEAITGARALAYLNAQDEALQSASEILKTPRSSVLERIEILASEKKSLEKEVADLRRKLAAGGGASKDGLAVDDICGVKFTGQVLEGFAPKDLKPLADDLKKKIGSGVIALVATNDGKASIVIGVTKDLTDKICAVDLVRVGSAALGGKGGGGRPDMAQAGGPNAESAQAAVDAVRGSLAG